MIFVNQLIAVGGRKFCNGLFPTGIPRAVNNLLKCVDIHLFKTVNSQRSS